MARAWSAKCTRCDEVVRYADQLWLRDASLGRPRITQCSKCQRLEAHGLKTTAVGRMLLAAETAPSVAPLGRIDNRRAEHRLDERPSGFVREQFGVADEEVQALYHELLRSDTPVVIAVAPTGSGKSTFLPYRLLVPIGLPLEAFTKGRQIVITQPRRGATIGIANYVSGTLHGADVGVGHEIGYRVSGDVQCDARNRLVYVTDGTLINWIVRGELDRLSLIVIDEAHERSLNIDVILGLITRCLPQYPHLKLLIVSATIDHEKFRKYFEDHLPGNQRCGVVNCSGTKPVGLTVHYRNERVGALPYAKGPLHDFGSDVAQHLADAIVRLVVTMESKMPQKSPSLPIGDVLGFLHGSKPIQEAVDRIKLRLETQYPELARKTDVYPLFAAVDEKTRRFAIDKKKDSSRRRIVIASNAAETSLTIDSLVHVVDSGFIKETQWDPVIEQEPLLPIAHSQAGCRQRWGRVGRTAEGFAWCLYTKDQFGAIFGRDTKPQIQRSCLDGVVLSAKRAGADRLDAASFPWLDAPSEAEIESSLVRLRRQRALDQDGDLTEAGVEIALSGGEDASYAQLVADADRFGFGIEVATLLPYVKEGLRDLFPDDRSWEPEKHRAIRAAQDRVRSACADDLELCLRVFQAWHGSPEWAARNGVDTTVIRSAAAARADLIRQLGAKKKELEDRDIDFGGLNRLRALMARAFPEQVYVRTAEDGEDARYQPLAGTNDAPLLGIDVASACRDRPPRALIAIGPKRPRFSKHADDAAPVVLSHFVVHIELEVFEAVRVLNDLELANYFREHMPRPLRGSEQDHRRKIGEALRKQFPIGTLVECRVREVNEAGVEVEVLRNAGWAGKRIPSVVSSSRREKQADKKERDFDFRFEATPSQRRPSPGVEEEANDLVAEAMEADAESESSGDPSAERPQPARGRLRQFGKPRPIRPGEVLRAEVTQYSDLSSLPELLLVTPSTEERFRAFQERYRVGQDIEVQVTGYAPGNARLSGLMVRECVTGVEAIVPSAEIVLFSEPALLRPIPIGARFPLRVEAVNGEAMEVSLSGLSRLEPRLAALRDSDGVTHASRIVATDYDERNVYLHAVLEDSAPELGLVVATKPVMPRDRFEVTGRLRLPALGERVHVKLRKNGRSTSRTGASRLTPRDAMALEQASITVEGDRLVADRPIPLADCNQLARGSSSPGLDAAVRELWIASNLLHGDRIVTDLEQRFPIGNVVSGAVTGLGREGLSMALDGGIKGLVSVQEVSWWTAKPLVREFAKVGDTCRVKVLNVDPENQLVRLSLKQVTDDPWKGRIDRIYPAGKLVRGAVREILPFGAFVRLEPGLDALIPISGMRKYHGRFVDDPCNVVRVGDLVVVSIKETHRSRKRISVELASRVGRVQEESPTSRVSQAPAGAEPLGWDEPEWPWGAGENAIVPDRKRPEQGHPPPLPKRVPLERRSSPFTWSLKWR